MPGRRPPLSSDAFHCKSFESGVFSLSILRKFGCIRFPKYPGPNAYTEGAMKFLASAPLAKDATSLEGGTMRLLNLLAITVFYGMYGTSLMAQSGAHQTLTGDQVVERVSPSAVSILVGKGEGQVAGVASGVIIRSDGVVLTANHVVRGMR